MGLPFGFVRLSECNLRCRWCDTKYSFPKGRAYSIDRVLSILDTYPTQWVLITGGEPLLQEAVYSLIDTLLEGGYRVCLETSGSLPIDRVREEVWISLDIKCPSSGEVSRNHYPNLRKQRERIEYKFVVANREDFDFAVEVIEKNLLGKEIVFSPAYPLLSPTQLAEWIKEKGSPYRMQIQLHKWLWGEKRGV